MRGSEACVRLLLECRADLHIADKMGLTAFAHAERKGYSSCARLLVPGGRGLGRDARAFERKLRHRSCSNESVRSCSTTASGQSTPRSSRVSAVSSTVSLEQISATDLTQALKSAARW